LPTWLTVIEWIVVVPLGIVALMRIVAWDDLSLFAMLNTVTVFVYLPAWLVMVVAAVGRRFALVVVAAVVAIAQIAFLYPELSAATPAPAWTSSAFSIRLLDANVYNENKSMAGYAAQIRQDRPQLVTMEEANPADVDQLRHAGVLGDLPYRIEIRRYDPRAFFIASHYPLSGDDAVWFAGAPLIIQTVVQLPSGPQDLWVIHTVPPLPSTYSQWKEELVEIDKLLVARGSKHLLVVGDFNATWGNRGFRSILGSGMTDGAAARGEALDMTWSQVERPLPPFVRIDHVLTGPGVAVTSIRTHAGPGSDHRDLWATVAFRDRS
jgi:endonuclease/exonuclease/phosphatase (EEP) superfamily protein YafD